MSTDIDIDQNSPPEPMAPAQPPISETAPPGNLPGPDIEVDYRDVIAEEKGEGPLDTPEKPEEEPEDVVDILRPKAEVHTWTFGPDDMKFEYVQKPLSFIAKMQWFSLVGEVLDKAMSGPDGVGVGELLQAPQGRGTQLTLTDFADADTFVRAIGKLLIHAPDFLTRSYCIWLNVPAHQQRLVAEVMALPEDEGGLSDDVGLEIIEVFIDQNFDALADFFGSKIGALQKRVARRQEERTKRGGGVRA